MRRTNSWLLRVVLWALFAALVVGCSNGKSKPPIVYDGDADSDSELEPDLGDGDGELEGEQEEAEEIASDADEADSTEADEEMPPAGTLAVSPESLDFGQTAFGASDTRDLDIHNNATTGSSPITVTSIEWTRDSDPSFTLGACPLPFTLAAQAKKTCSILFAPKKPGTLTATLRVIARDAQNSPLEVRLAIGGLCQLPKSWVDLNRKNFGAVKVGQKALAYVSLGNAGSTPWTVKQLRFAEGSDPAFTLTPLGEVSYPLTLGFNEGRLYRLTFAPKSANEVFAKLLIESDENQAPRYTVALAGRGHSLCPDTRKDEPSDGDSEAEDEAEGESALPQDPATCALCIPGEGRCSAENKGVELCNESGAAWSAATACPLGMTCRGGVCGFALCEEDAVLCQNGRPLHCAKADTPEPAASCLAASACQDTTCHAGSGCQVLNAAARCDDDNLCTTDSCQSDGTCLHAFNTLSCPDKDACTTHSQCLSGYCVGTVLSCDDHNPCTSEHCDLTLGCVTTNKDGGACTDNDICTQGDHCESGRCVGAALPCDDGNGCTSDSCDPEHGCVFSGSNAGCDDHNACTSQDHCVSGRCQGQPLYVPDGKFCNGFEACTAENGILHIAAPVCNDGIACTRDSCSDAQNGCVFTPDNTLCDDENPCTNDLCSATLGCVTENVADKTPCTNLGGREEACYGGQCVAACTTDLDCLDAFECTFDSCDTATGHCRHEPFDALCDDGSFCNGPRTCSPTRGCIAGTPVDCTDAFACTADYCDESKRACVHTPIDTRCNDYNGCTIERCDPSLGGCVFSSLETACDDADPCTAGDHCQLGHCQSGEEHPSCDDGNPCTDDVCVPGKGCAHLPNARPCDDGIACTTMDTCQDGYCVGVALSCDDGLYCNGVESCGGSGCRPGTKPDCDDGVACTLDVCDEKAQGCAHLLVDTLCEDNDPCTLDEHCTLSGCASEQAPDETICGRAALGDKRCFAGTCLAPCKEDSDCDDAIGCTTDTCDKGRGYCVHTANNTLCNDGKFCNGTEVCHPTLGCQPGARPNCDDHIACTVDSCDEIGQVCRHTADSSVCDDGNPCTTDLCGEAGCTHTLGMGDCDDHDPCTELDTCASGFCRGTPKRCDDGNPCTLDVCQSGVGCTAPPALDGTACTQDDHTNGVCRSGVCQSGCQSDSDCISPVACAQPYCDQSTHHCELLARHDWCDDGLFCNGVETCDIQFGCLPGIALNCDDGVACTVDRCDSRDGSCRHTPDVRLCDDHNPCTDDSCSAQGCANIPNTRSCDDGNACTQNDTCQAGSCSGTPRVCDDGNACTDNRCEPALGCVFPKSAPPAVLDDCHQVQCQPSLGWRLVAKSGPCDDHNANTRNDVCVAGVCGGTPAACDDHNECTSDSSTPGGCVFTPLGDARPCTFSGVVPGECLGGVCRVACSQDDDCADRQACSSERCDPISKTCVYTLDDTLCDDGVFCNGHESCEPFIGCLPGTTPRCDDALPCTADRCDGATDSCTHTPNDARCDDNNPCTSEHCDTNTGCVYTPLSGTSCDDGNACTQNDTCQSGRCEGSARLCEASNPCLDTPSCNPLFGCLATPRRDGLACGAEGELCLDGECAKACTNDAQCDDAIPCTRDYCDTTIKRCRHFANSAACDDGHFCNGTETCLPGIGCVAGLPVDCDDQVACTLDACDDTSKRCTHTLNPLACQTGRPCTTDRCDALLGCVSTPQSDTACDDGNSCTQNERCQNGVCTGGSALACGPCRPEDNPLLCDPSGGCMTYGCDSRVGCVSRAKPNGRGLPGRSLQRAKELPLRRLSILQ